MNNADASLVYAARPAALRYYLCRLSLVLAVLTLVPLLGVLLLGELRLAGSLAGCAVVLILLWLPGRSTHAPRRLQENEALAIVALTFVLAPVLMLPPFVGEGLPLVDALFESVSAITTTGLSTVSPEYRYSSGLLLLRAWMQWYGGLGIAVFSVALVLRLTSGTRRLSGADVLEDLPESTRAYARKVLTAYLGLTALALAALWLALGDGLQALLHALTAVSTGGFSGYERSLADMPAGVAPFLTIGAALTGALPLILYYQVASRRPRELSGDPEWWSLPLLVLMVAGLLVLILRWGDGMSWTEALYHGSLLGGSAQTTAGFSTLSVGALGDAAKLLLVMAMFCGGAVGSTAGGIKLLRLLILARILAFRLRRTSMPTHAVAAARLGGHELTSQEIQRALVVILLFLLTVVLSWLVMVVAGQPVLDSLFDVASAVGTVGLSTGVVGPELATGLKLLLCFDMLLGRLEVLALLVVLYPRTWVGRRVEG